jgi:hypothetical protein
MSKASKLLEKINESKWSTLLYHSTAGEFNPKDIKPGSHFGTLKAALDRSRSEFKAIPLSKIKLHAFDYKPSGKTVHIGDDTSEHFPTNIAASLHGSGHISAEDKQYIRNKPPQEHGGPALTAGSHEHLLQILKKKNISHLTYENTYEDPGSLSHIIYDPENLKLVHTFTGSKKLKNRYL